MIEQNIDPSNIHNSNMSAVQNYLGLVEKQNDLLAENKLVDFLGNECYLTNLLDGHQIDNADSNLFIEDVLNGDTSESNSSEIDNQDIESMQALMRQSKESLMALRIRQAELIDWLGQQDVDFKQGLSFLSIMIQSQTLYSSYLNLFYIMKLNGETVKNHPLVMKQLFQKQVQIKVRPIYIKLEHQIQRSIKLVQSGESVDQGESYQARLSYELKANPDRFNMKNKNQNEASNDLDMEDFLSDKEDDTVIRNQSMQKRTSEMDTTDDLKLNPKQMKQKRRDTLKEKAQLKDSIINELQDEIEDKPQVIRKKMNLKNYYDAEEDKLERLEEDYMVRYRNTGADKKKRNKKQNDLQNQGKIDDFSDLLKIRKLVEMQNPNKFASQSSHELKKLYRNDSLKEKIKNARQRFINKKERDDGTDETLTGVRNKFKKFTNKKSKGGKKAKGKK